MGGALYCWGENRLIGNGVVSGNTSIPTAVTALTTGVTQVAVGNDMACAIQSGALYCWGGNSSGDVGDGSSLPQNTPVQIFASGVTDVSLGHMTGCAVVNGVVWCWGQNYNGQAGVNTGISSVSTPTMLPESQFAGPVTQVSVGYSHACALSGGVVKCWGANGTGQLGDGTMSNTTVPVVARPN
jgi:alpha-tubulin suppressor-like RCC1 family protein